MVRLVGSIVSRPVFPAGARVSTPPVMLRPVLPLTSIWPPLPPSAPPRAERCPANTVCSVDSSAIAPPLPVRPPLALMRAPAATSTPRAVPGGIPPAPCASARAAVVPSATVPPPRAEMCAVDVIDTVSLAFITTVPPCVPSACTRPAMLTEPPIAETSMLPGVLPTVFACSRPLLFTRLVTIPSAALAVSTIVPPSALITPELVTSDTPPPGAVRTCLVTSTLISPSP